MATEVAEMIPQRSKGRAPPSQKPKDAKRRKCARYRIDEASEATWLVKGDQWTARVCNMSIGGLALLSNRPLELASILQVTIHAGANRPGQAVRLRVAHSESRPDGKWLIGCAILET